jgi:hypothetical protein
VTFKYLRHARGSWPRVLASRSRYLVPPPAPHLVTVRLDVHVTLFRLRPLPASGALMSGVIKDPLRSTSMALKIVGGLSFAAPDRPPFQPLHLPLPLHPMVATTVVLFNAFTSHQLLFTKFAHFRVEICYTIPQINSRFGNPSGILGPGTLVRLHSPPVSFQPSCAAEAGFAKDIRLSFLAGDYDLLYQIDTNHYLGNIIYEGKGKLLFLTWWRYYLGTRHEDHDSEESTKRSARSTHDGN